MSITFLSCYLKMSVTLISYCLSVYCLFFMLPTLFNLLKFLSVLNGRYQCASSSSSAFECWLIIRNLQPGQSPPSSPGFSGSPMRFLSVPLTRARSMLGGLSRLEGLLDVLYSLDTKTAILKVNDET